MEDMFNIVKKGYDPEAVNRYIDELETVVRSYKEKDAAINKAIVNAQIMADGIVERARLESAKIKAEAVRFLDENIEAVAAHKKEAIAYRHEYEALIRKYLSRLEENENSFITSADNIESHLEKIKASILEKAHGGVTAGDTNSK